MPKMDDGSPCIMFILNTIIIAYPVVGKSNISVNVY